MRISTVIVSAKRSACVDRIRRSFLMTGASQITKANFSLLPILIGKSCAAPILWPRKAPVDYTAIKI